MTIHSLQELRTVLATEGKEITRIKGNEKVGGCAKPTEASPPNYCVVCHCKIEFYYPYGRWVDKHNPKNLHSGTCSNKCEDIADPRGAAFRAMRAANRVA